MKCPKCGYNSFDYLEACKKCGNDLHAHRTRFGLKSLFFGGAGRDPEPQLRTEAEMAEAERNAETPTHFGFDFMTEENTGDSAAASPQRDDGPAGGLSPAGTAQATVDFDNPGEKDYGEAGDELSDPFADEFAPFEPASEDDFFAETFAPSDSDALETGAGNDSCEFDPFAEEAAFREAEPFSEFAAPTAETAPPLDVPLSSAERDAEGPANPSPEKEPDELHTAEMQEEDGFGEANLAEMFLDSLDIEETSPETPEATPFGFHEEDPFGDIAADVPLMEGDLWERGETGAEGTEEAETWSPGEGAKEVEQPGDALPPSLRSRLGAAAADLFILAVIFLLFLAAGEAASGAAHGEIFPSLPRLLNMAAPYFLVLFASCFGYFTLFHFLLGQTPGKMLFRLKVVAEDGEALLLSQAFLRSVGGLLSLLPAGLGYLRILFDARRRGWNDRLANSRIVSLGAKDSPAPGENLLQAAETE